VIAATVTGPGGPMRVINGYFVNGPAPESDKFAYKMKWLDGLKAYVRAELARQPRLLLMGDFNITPKWKLGASGFYDLRTAKMQSLTTFISRDLHCWQLSINVTPVGPFRFFNMSISPKSGMLRDLRINRTRYFYSN
jgi:endonuclease/exonuclease/phosphatase family metal-dependent hydrolase